MNQLLKCLKLNAILVWFKRLYFLHH